jgi:carboxyl-terminal processing protease
MIKNIFRSKIILFLAAILIGFYLNNIISYFINPKLSQASNKINEVLSITNEYYVESVNLDTLTDRAINGILSKLDPHSTYLTAEEHESYAEEMSGKFVGIGIEFIVINDTLNIISILPGGPSDKAGILSGDKIIKVNNKSIIGFKNEQIIKLLRGDEGSNVSLSIFRNNSKKINEFILKREEIILHPVEFSTILDKNIGYIKLNRFSENTYSEVRNAVNSLIKQGANKFLLDLRNNPGGYLEQAVKVTDLFLPPNKLIVSVKARKASFNQDFYSRDVDKSDNLPIIVLVDNGSASASEIVAGAIQDWDRGWILGKNTFGKGLVQQSFLLKDNSELRLTLAIYFTPSGRLIQRKYDKLEDYYSLSEINKIDTNKRVKYTKNGRKVYDEGGIHPDFLISDKNYSDVFLVLLKNNIFTTFINDNAELNKIDKDKYTLTNFNKEFIFTENYLKSFIIYALSKVKNIKAEQILADKEAIVNRIKIELANKLWGKKGRYTISVENDVVINKAINYFSVDINKIVKKR